MEVSEQRFTGTDEDGDEVELRNLIGVLPGPSERQVAVIADRDVLTGTGAASTIASTAALLEIASAFAGSTHEKTLVFVSSDGGSIGAVGARRFAEDYSDAALLDAVIAISQPAADQVTAAAGGALVHRARAAPASGWTQTATRTVTEEAGPRGRRRGAISTRSSDSRSPPALGEQGPLVEMGFDSVRLSSSGELPLPAGRGHRGRDQHRHPRPLRPRGAVADARGGRGPRAARARSRNLHRAGRQPAAGLDPGDAGAGAVAGAGRSRLRRGRGSRRQPEEALRAVGWVTLRAVPFLLGFVLLALAAWSDWSRARSSPSLPGGREWASAARSRSRSRPSRSWSAPSCCARCCRRRPRWLALAPAAALSLAALAGFGIWLINPYSGPAGGAGAAALGARRGRGRAGQAGRGRPGAGGPDPAAGRRRRSGRPLRRRPRASSWTCC